MQNEKKDINIAEEFKHRNMGYFADKLKDKLSSMSDEEFDEWWRVVEAKRTDVNAISAAEYQDVVDNYIYSNMIMGIDKLAEDCAFVVIDRVEMQFSEEDYNLAA